MAICAFMSGSMKDDEKYFELAESTYFTQLQLPLNAFRIAYVHVESLLEREMHADAFSALQRLTCEGQDLLNAIVLERIAVCFLMLPVSMKRKAGFYYTLASNRYERGGQMQHAERAENNALCLFRGKHWLLLKDHLHYTIGKLCRELSYWEKSIHHLTLLNRETEDGQRPFQSLYLNELMASYKKWCASLGSNPWIKNVDIPLIVKSSLRWRLKDANTLVDASEAQAAFSRRLAELAEPGSRPSSPRAAYAGHGAAGPIEATPCIAFGDTLTLDMELDNHYALTLHLFDLTLVILSSQGETQQIPITETIAEVVLPPQSSRSIVLKYRSAEPGLYTICGLTYRLNGYIFIYREFSTPFVISILYASSTLHCQLATVPAQLSHGQVSRVESVLTTTLPSSLLQDETMQVDIMSSRSDMLFVGLASTQSSASGFEPLANSFRAPSNACLSVEHAFNTPYPFDACFYGREPGVWHVSLYVRYRKKEVNEPKSALQAAYRYIQFDFSFTVLPLLKLTMSLKPSFRDFCSYIMVLKASRDGDGRAF